MTFLQELHDFKSRNFDNSTVIPSEIKSKYSARTDPVGELIQYINHKFLYLILLADEEQNADEFFSTIIQRNGKSELAQFVQAWKEKAGAEELAYNYRLSQLPSDVVHRQWYAQDVEECYKWCARLSSKLEKAKESVERDWYVRIGDLYGGIGARASSSFVEDSSLALLSKRAISAMVNRIDYLKVALEKSRVSFDEMNGRLTQECQEVLRDLERTLRGLNLAEDGRGLVDANWLGDLALKLMEKVYAEGFDETPVIIEFIRELSTAFRCEVCDYLDVSRGGEMVVWRAATVGEADLSPEYQKLAKEEFRRRVQERESYRRGVGITGSILLLDSGSRDIWRHIGSNDVLNDPRQSEEHRSAYESDMYPGVLKNNRRINNFWAFPVFVGSRMVGVFRVVNKLDEDGILQAGGWAYLTRVQLALVSEWFSRFWATVGAQVENKADFAMIRERNRQIDEMIRRLNLEWVDKTSLQALLRHVTRDISKKHEKRQVGCCIVVTQVEEGGRALERFESYPLIDVSPGDVPSPYDMLDRYHDAVDPLQGAYVFDQSGRFSRIVKLEWRGDGGKIYSGEEAVFQMMRGYPKSLCLMLRRETKNILGYCDGGRAIEIFISEGTGEWRFRYPKDILELMERNGGDVRSEVIKIVWEATLEMSYRGMGGIFVVGKAPSEPFAFGDPKIPFKRHEKVQHIGKALLVEFAKLDGATFVDCEGFITRVNTTVRAIEPPSRTLFIGKGARHEAGETISKKAPQALVVIISENRGVSLVRNGSLIEEGV